MKNLNNGESNLIIRSAINDNFRELDARINAIVQQMGGLPGNATAKVAVRLSGDSFIRNIGGTGTGSSASGSQPGPLSITHQLAARLQQQSGSAVQFTVTDDGGSPGEKAEWFAANGGGRLDQAKDYIRNQSSNFDKIIFIALYGTNDEGASGVNGTTSVDSIISQMNSAYTQLKALSEKVITIGYPLTLRKDAYAQPGSNVFRNNYNSRISADPSVINANAVGNYTLYPEIYSDNAPVSDYFVQNDADGLSAVHPSDKGYYRLTEMLAQQIARLSGAALTTDGDPIIYVHPQSQSVAQGQGFSLTVNAQGLNLSYQWRKNGTIISGATTPKLAIAGSATSDNGTYDCVVSNNIRTVTSQAANVQVSQTQQVLTSRLPSNLNYLAILSADNSGVNEVAGQGNLTSFPGRGTPVLQSNAINGKAAYLFNGSTSDGLKLTLNNVDNTVMVAVVARINSMQSGIGSLILSLPTNDCRFLLNNNYGDGRRISLVQGQEIGGPGVDAGLATGELRSMVFFTDNGAPKVRLKGNTYTATGNGGFVPLAAAMNDFLIGGSTNTSYPSPFDGLLGCMVIANGNITEASAIQMEAALNNYYNLS